MPNGAGRPRDKQIDRDILSATAALLTEKGYSGLTMEAVASRAAISKHSLYLRYKSPAQLTVGLLNQLAASTIRIPDHGNLKDDLVSMMTDIDCLFSETAFGSVIPALVGASPGNPELTRYARTFLGARRELMRPIILRAIARGELPDGTDPEITLELCLAPIYYRHLISGSEISSDYLEYIAAQIALPRPVT